MRWLTLALGAVWLVVLLTDVFGTVFVPRGWARPRDRMGVSDGMGGVATGGHSRPRRHRRRVLGLGGPLLVPLTAGLWAAHLVIAFTLLYLPLVNGLSLPLAAPAR